METNRIFAPEYPAPFLTPAANQPTPQPTEAELPRYSKAEAAHMASLLPGPFNAQCILLFGSLAGGTPHSDITAYDLLIITDEEPYYGMDSPRRLLKMKIPPKHREIFHINPLIYTRKFIDKNPSPVFHFAMSEGVILFEHPHFQLERPSKFDFGTAYCNTSRYFDTFFGMADSILENAGMSFTVNNIRLTAYYSAQAATMLLRTLFYVYYGFETDCTDPVALYHRLRTLSSELMLVVDPELYLAQSLIPRLRKYLSDARDNPVFTIAARTVESDMDYVDKLKDIIEKACRQRIALYKQHRQQ